MTARSSAAGHRGLPVLLGEAATFTFEIQISVLCHWTHFREVKIFASRFAPDLFLAEVNGSRKVAPDDSRMRMFFTKHPHGGLEGLLIQIDSAV